MKSETVAIISSVIIKLAFLAAAIWLFATSHILSGVLMLLAAIVFVFGTSDDDDYDDTEVNIT